MARQSRPRGLPGAGPPRAVRAGEGVWLVVASAPLDRYAADVIDTRLADLDWVSRCAVAHDAVIEHFARLHPVIPMKLFTLFTSDERAVAHVARTRRRLDRLFARVADREEWGVRLLLDERRALERAGDPRGRAPERAGDPRGRAPERAGDPRGRAPERAGDPRGRAPERAGAAREPASSKSGTEFLARKKAAKDARQQVVADALAEADRTYEALTRLADDSRRRTPAVEGPTSRMVLDAAFLVARRDGRRFRAAASAMAKTLGTRGFALSLTGPWPPYHFVADEP